MQQSHEPKQKTQRSAATQQRDTKRDKPEHNRKAQREQKRAF